jgi:hypothetical protein
MSTLISDLFSDADATVVTSRASAIGGTPAEHEDFTSGGASIHEDAAYPTGSGATVIAWPNTLTDAIAEAVIDVKSSIAEQYFALALRAASNEVRWVSGGTGNLSGSTWESFVYNTGLPPSGGYHLPANGTGLAAGEHRLKTVRCRQPHSIPCQPSGSLPHQE